MSKSDLVNAAETILFSSGDPVEADRLAGALEIEEKQLDSVIKKLTEKYPPSGGVHIIRLENSYQMVSNPKYAPEVRRVFEMKRNTPLSQAAFEVLAVVAYNQPVTKSYIEQVRGVDCTGVVASLCIKGLIEECGRLDLPGRPLLYRTTDHFLRCFSLESLENLPAIPDPEEIKEKLADELNLSDAARSELSAPSADNPDQTE